MKLVTIAVAAVGAAMALAPTAHALTDAEQAFLDIYADAGMPIAADERASAIESAHGMCDLLDAGADPADLGGENPFAFILLLGASQTICPQHADAVGAAAEAANE